jgi:sugar lactone lactonase YvrE
MPEVLAEGLAHVEAPRWRDGALWLSDMTARECCAWPRTAPSAPSRRSRARRAGSASRLTASSSPSRSPTARCGGWRRTARGRSLLSALTVRPNDLAVDARGRVYVSQWGYDAAAGDEAVPSRLTLVAPVAPPRPCGGELTFPNGIAISGDGRTLVVAESHAHRLSAFDVEPDRTLSQQRGFAAFAEGEVPDGICIDAPEGCGRRCRSRPSSAACSTAAR